MNDCSIIFQNISALRALGGDVKKISISRIVNYVPMVENSSAYINALRAVGGNVEIFRTKFLRGDRDEKIDFRRITSHAP